MIVRPPLRGPRAALLALLLAGACGGKTGLEVGPLGDGGAPDPDMATPADMATPDMGPPPELEVDCGRSTRFTTPRLPLMLTAEVTLAGSPLASSGWSILSSPPASMATVTPTTGPTTTLLQNAVGFYELTFEARDGTGAVARCMVQVESIVGPPRAICPEEELVTGQDVPLRVEGDGFDDIAVADYRWSVLSGPGEAVLSPPDAAITNFRASARGLYELELTVTDEDGAANSCLTRVRVVGPPVIDCPGPVMARTRQPVTVSVAVRDEIAITEGRFEIVSRPPGSTATIDAQSRVGDSFEMTFTPDRPGAYEVQLQVTNEAGLTAECVFTVQAAETPPEALCPPPIDVRPLSTATLRGDGVDDGTIVSYRWRLIDAPDGSSRPAPMPANAQETQFTPDIAGEYTLELTIRDDSGHEVSCTTLVRAVNSEGLRIEMFWDTASTDMDVHLLNPAGTQWRTDDSCYYANCRPRNMWGGPGEDDDPRLDIDDTDGFGPENINILTPQDGVYRVGVDAFRGTAGQVTVNVYCGGSTTEPQATFRSTRLRGDSSHFWRVADVTISGLGCTIEQLFATGGGLDIRSERDTDPFPR